MEQDGVLRRQGGAVALAAQAKATHSRARSRTRAQQGILDDQARSRIGAGRARRAEKEIGRRLATPALGQHVLGAVDAARDKAGEAGSANFAASS